MQQMHKGVPITAGELLVHLKGSRAMAANGRTLGDLPDDVLPRVSPAFAQFIARQVIDKRHIEVAEGAKYSEPRLEIRVPAALPIVCRSCRCWSVLCGRKGTAAENEDENPGCIANA